MSITEETEEAVVQITGPYRHVQVRTDLVVKKDGVEIARKNTRKIIHPNMDPSGESDYVRGICELVHTDDIKAAYTAYTAQSSSD